MNEDNVDVAPETDTSFEGLVTEELGPAPTEPGQPESAAPASPATPEQEPAPQEAQPPQAGPNWGDETFILDGKIYKKSDLQSDPNLFNLFVTRANQTGHYAGLYNSLLQNTRQPQQQPPPGAQSQPDLTRPQITARQLQDHYKPEMDRMVKEGWLDADLVELAPQSVASFMWLKDLVVDQRIALHQVLTMARAYGQNIQQDQIRTDLDGLIGGLKEQGPLYADLGDPKRVEAFREHVLGLGGGVVPIGVIRNPDFLKQQWIAFNSGNFTQLVNQSLEADRARAAADAARRRRAGGVGAGAPRPVGGAPKEPAPWDKVVDQQLNLGNE